ncbi:MAG TPA: carboxy terminal-processing peptidase [Pirellulales bacterium]|nr:carboxy terminal-processing peptidase [Pirellulales bacterium]
MIHPVAAVHRFRSRFFLGLGSALALGALALGAVKVSWADLGAPAPADRNVTNAVVGLLNTDHLLRHPLDDEISERLLKGFIRMLDSPKLYFYQSDIDAFTTKKDVLDDQIKLGDVSFSYTVYRTLLKRIDERVALIDQLLEMDHDFTIDEDLVIDPDEAHYPKDAAEASELWRKRIKYELLALKADAKAKAKAEKDRDSEPTKREPAKTDKPSKPPEDPRQRLRRRYHNIAKLRHRADHEELLEMYLTSLTTSFDPHTSYMSPSSYENFEIMMRLNLEGIGASLQYDVDDGYTVVKQIIPGGAADRDGRLKRDDRIVGVGQGETGTVVATMEMKLNDVVAMIRGHRGTTVRLEVIPAAQTDPQIYNIVRDKIALTESEARSEIVEQEKDGRKYKVGVIDLPSFYMDMDAAKNGHDDFKSTTRDVAALLDGFREKQVDAVVLDLRRNGGGSLTEAINLTGLFIDQGPIVQVKDKDSHIQHYDDPVEGTAWDGPLVVLTSKLSASASEIFAGAIQDYGRGLIVGDKTTHGKGTVQSLQDLGRKLFRLGNAPHMGALKITMQQFYRPNGDSTQNRGVLADIELPSFTNVIEKLGEADLDYALKFDHIPSVPHQRMHLVDKTVVGRMTRLSAERRAQSAGFQKLSRDIQRYVEQKGRAVSLNERKFMAEREEWSAEREEEKQIEELGNAKRPVFDMEDYYNQETLAIAVDYLQLIRVASAN